MRNTSSTTASACASPAATSPWRIRKRWQTLLRAIGRTSIDTASRAEAAACSWTSGAPGATASSGSNTAGRSLTNTSTRLAAARAAARVGAATAAITSPTCRATSASTRWSLTWHP